MNIAIVTGASSGLGRSFIRQLDRQGGLDEIWGVARRRERMEELAAQLSTPMRPLALDLTKTESVETLLLSSPKRERLESIFSALFLSWVTRRRLFITLRLSIRRSS